MLRYSRALLPCHVLTLLSGDRVALRPLHSVAILPVKNQVLIIIPVKSCQVLPGNLCALRLLHLFGDVFTDLPGHSGALHSLHVSWNLLAILDLLLARHLGALRALHLSGHLPALLLLHLTRYLATVLLLHLTWHLLALGPRLLARNFIAFRSLHLTRHILALHSRHLNRHLPALLSRHLSQTLYNFKIRGRCTCLDTSKHSSPSSCLHFCSGICLGT